MLCAFYSIMHKLCC